MGVTELDLIPLSPWCGEPKSYTLFCPGAPALELHPSRAMRLLGNPLPDPTLAGALWSDSVLQALYDAVHAAALSERLSSAEIIEQLSARFAHAAAMQSMVARPCRATARPGSGRGSRG